MEEPPPTATDTLSVLVPVYDEAPSVGELLRRVIEVDLSGLKKEIVVVDDGSTDGTPDEVARVRDDHPGVDISVVRHPENRGKGAAIRTALDHARGEYCIVQDADLEYDPSDYAAVLEPLVRGEVDAVYGSRFLDGGPGRMASVWHGPANRFLTWASNLLTGLDLTDMETCYKAFRTEDLRAMPLRRDGFGIEPEITAQVARRGLRIREVPIRYRARRDGKKLGWMDGLRAIWVILAGWWARGEGETEPEDGSGAPGVGEDARVSGRRVGRTP